MDYTTARRAMVDSQLRPQGVTDPLVIAAMATVPREQFVPPAVREIAYIDRNLPLSGDRALSPPATVGRMLTELEARPGERALVVGAATGYTAAVLAEMGLEVTAVESDPVLLDRLAALDGDVRVVAGGLEAGAPEGAPYDLILIDGQVECIPDTLVEQLREGGRLSACLLQNDVPRLVIGRRSAHGFGVKSFADATASPLPGFARPRAFTF